MSLNIFYFIYIFISASSDASASAIHSAIHQFRCRNSIKGATMLNPIEKFKRSILHLNRALHHWISVDGLWCFHPYTQVKTWEIQQLLILYLGVLLFSAVIIFMYYIASIFLPHNMLYQECQASGLSVGNITGRWRTGKTLGLKSWKETRNIIQMVMSKLAW